MRSRVWNRFPASTTSFTSSATRPSRIIDRKSTRLNSSHLVISYAVFCLKKKKKVKSCGSPLPQEVIRRTEDRGVSGETTDIAASSMRPEPRTHASHIVLYALTPLVHNE